MAAVARKISFILCLLLLLSLFSGGYHHLCEFASPDCSISAHPDNQPALCAAQPYADGIRPAPISLFLSRSGEFFPDHAESFTPLKGRAPPA